MCYKIIMLVIFSGSWTIMAVKSFQPRALVKSHWIQIQLSAHHLTSSPSYIVSVSLEQKLGLRTPCLRS